MRPSHPVLALLLVDNEPLLRGAVRAILELYGWVVLEAGEPLEAASLFRNSPLPVRGLVARLDLPGMSAPQLSDLLARSGRPIPGLYYSATTLYSGRGFTSFERFLREPFGMAELITGLADVLQSGEAEPPERRPSVSSAPSHHVMKLYEDDQGLSEAVAPFLAEGLQAGEPITVIATRTHWSAIEAGMVRRGCNPAAAAAAGQLSIHDAPETLARLRPGAAGDRERFHAFVKSLGSPGAKAGTRAYGEMVDLLWRAGRLDDALVLEGWWNEFLGRTTCRMLCGYHRSLLGTREPGAFSRVAGVHSHVVLA